MKSKNYTSYCRSLRRKEYDWVIIISKNCKNMTSKDLDLIREFGHSNVTGPVGNLAVNIERNDEGIAKDVVLRNMQKNFIKYTSRMEDLISYTDYVKANKVRKKCLSIVKTINKREGMLVKEHMIDHKINKRTLKKDETFFLEEIPKYVRN